MANGMSQDRAAPNFLCGGRLSQPRHLLYYIYFMVMSLKFHSIFHHISCFMNIVPFAYIGTRNMPMQSDAYKCL